MKADYARLKAEILTAVAHPNRIRIIEFLAEGPKCACEIIPALKLEQSNLSRHMKILVQSGIVNHWKDGKKSMYEISDKNDIDVFKSEIVALIGPNGAGKSTCLKAIANLLDCQNGKVDSGEIVFNEQSILGVRTDQLVKNGIALIPEGRRLFPSMTVLENLEMGAFIENDKPVIQNNLESIFELFPKLKERFKQKAGTLSSGEQQMLALGRALMMKPKLLLADEPSVGLSPNYSDLIFEKLSEINKSGITVLLVEQNVSAALDIADRGYVFSIGRITMQDDAKNLKNNPAIIKAYLGN